MAYDKNHISLSPIKITFIYLFAAALWIIFSDWALEIFVPDLQNISAFQTYKGLFYVALTSAILYFLIKIYADQIAFKEDELKSERELSSMLFERIPVLITIYDPKLQEFEVNREFEKVIGWTNKEIENDEVHLLEACYPDHEKREKIVEFMNNPGVGWKEFEMTTKSGKTIPVSFTNIRLTDETSVGIGIDMSDIKASQAELKKSRELLRNIFESLESSLIIVNPQTRTIVDCNSATKDIFGYSEDELIGSSTKMLHVDEESYRKFDKMGSNALEKNGVFQTEFQMKKKDDTVFYSDHTVTLVYDEDGEVDKAISVIRDITERKENELELKRQRERLLRSQKIGKIGDWELNPKTNEISWSAAMYEIYERDPKLGPPTYEEIQNNYYGRSLIKHNEAVTQTIKKKKTFDIDLQLKTDKENKKFVRAIIIPKENEDGKVVKLVGIVQDITERKKLEQELKKEKQRFELVAQTTSDVIWDLDLADDTLWWSEGFEDHFGYDRNQMADDLSSWTDHIHPDDRKRATESLQQAISGEDKFWKEEYRFKLADGSTAHIIDRGIIIRDENGKAVRMVGTLNNITERKKAEQRLQESEEKYRHLFENNPQPMWIYNPDTLKFVEINKAAVSHYGYTEKEFLDMTLVDIRPPEEVDAMKKDVQQHLGTHSYSEEWTHLKKDGSEITVEISAADVQYDDHTYRLVLVNDITEQKNMQEKIIQSVLEGEDRERKRIAHELHDGLGQYLVASSMNFESIRNDIDRLPEKRTEQFKTGLSLLKQGLLEARNIAHNLMPKAITDYDLETALENLLENFRKSTDIEFHFLNTCSEYTFKDHVEINLYRICQELVTNAVRHAECSTISLRLLCEKNTLKLIVEDDGMGAELTDAHEEYGLGLRSMKTRVNNLKGQLDVQSTPGEGMKCTIKIPNIKRFETKGDSNG